MTFDAWEHLNNKINQLNITELKEYRAKLEDDLKSFQEDKNIVMNRSNASGIGLSYKEVRDGKLNNINQAIDYISLQIKQVGDHLLEQELEKAPIQWCNTNKYHNQIVIGKRYPTFV